MIPTEVFSHMGFPKDSIAVCTAEVEEWRWTPPHHSDGETTANYSWHFLWWHFSTASLLNGISRTPVPSTHDHQHPTSNTHTLIHHPCRVTIAQQRLLPPAFTWLTPCSRCWIWSNHSQSSLNISFFKQNRGSKFHHSMTRSVADNTIKPIPAYPEGTISGGTAGRWDADLQKGVNLRWSTALFVSQLYCAASGCWRR